MHGLIQIAPRMVHLYVVNKMQRNHVSHNQLDISEAHAKSGAQQARQGFDNSDQLSYTVSKEPCGPTCGKPSTRLGITRKRTSRILIAQTRFTFLNVETECIPFSFPLISTCRIHSLLLECNPCLNRGIVANSPSAGRAKSGARIVHTPSSQSLANPILLNLR